MFKKWKTWAGIKLTFDFFKSRMIRIIRYFDNLINSFDIMIEGMSRDEFTKFRMSLLPEAAFKVSNLELLSYMQLQLKTY